MSCGTVFSGPFQTQMVAYELHLHGIQVGWTATPPPGVVFRTRTVPDGPLVVKPSDDRYRPSRPTANGGCSPSRRATVPGATVARPRSRTRDRPAHPRVIA